MYALISVVNDPRTNLYLHGEYERIKQYNKSLFPDEYMYSCTHTIVRGV